MKSHNLCLLVLLSASFACGQSSTQMEKVLTKVADIPCRVRQYGSTIKPSTHRVVGCTSRT
jgi:hypothetical protein